MGRAGGKLVEQGSAHGGARAGAGRPRALEPLEVRVVIRLTKGNAVKLDLERGEKSRGTLAREIVEAHLDAVPAVREYKRNGDKKGRK